MKIIINVLLVLVATVGVIQSGLKILNRKSKSIGDYIFVIIYIFNVVPVILDSIFGVPDYNLVSWYSSFRKASENETVSFVYNVYMLLCMGALKIYLQKNERFQSSHEELIYLDSNSSIFRGKLLLGVSLLPILYAFLTTSPVAMLTFQSASRRGTSNVGLLMFFELMGIFAFFCWFFRRTPRLHSYFWMIAYCFLISWVDGKRYLIVVLAMIFILFYQSSYYSREKKIPLKSIVIIGIVGFAIFYVSYALTYKVSSMVSQNSISDWMYLSFRIDFGRDDVTKFVLYRELIEKNSILEYRGETILSTLLFWVPRAIWASKPYPHYRYLTAALYGTTVLGIPAGMTPSWFEMGIANFGVWFGIPLSIFIMIWLIKKGDKAKTVPHKILYLILIESLLTQSLDAITFVLVALVVEGIFSRVRFTIGSRSLGGFNNG